MLRISNWIMCLGVVALATICTLQLFGQATQGTIFGNVTDQSGAAVPQAHVTVTSVERGTTRSTITSAAGEYTVPDLELGSYTVSVQASGFKKLPRTQQASLLQDFAALMLNEPVGIKPAAMAPTARFVQ